jgi:hypothetical protein
MALSSACLLKSRMQRVMLFSSVPKVNGPTYMGVLSGYRNKVGLTSWESCGFSQINAVENDGWIRRFSKRVGASHMSSWASFQVNESLVDSFLLRLSKHDQTPPMSLLLSSKTSKGRCMARFGVSQKDWRYVEWSSGRVLKITSDSLMACFSASQNAQELADEFLCSLLKPTRASLMAPFCFS